MGHILVIGNEKGGAGKSTIALHIAIHCMKLNQKTAIIDLDLRQRTLERFFENRLDWVKANSIELPTPSIIAISDLIDETDEFKSIEKIRARIDDIANQFDIVVIDSPGANSWAARAAHAVADTIVSPMNDSFVDFDLLAKIDPNTFDVIEPNVYANMIWEARKEKAKLHKRHLNWVVMRNRLSQIDAKNKRKVGEAIQKLSRRIGFRVIPGLSERVIYRELFPMGLTLLDLDVANIGYEMSMSHVAARQELRDVFEALGLTKLKNHELVA